MQVRVRLFLFSSSFLFFPSCAHLFSFTVKLRRGARHGGAGGDYEEHLGGAHDGSGGLVDGEEPEVDQWQILFDEQGYQYFYNATTGHSQWEDPRDAIAAEEAAAAAAEEEEEAEQRARAHPHAVAYGNVGVEDVEDLDSGAWGEGAAPDSERVGAEVGAAGADAASTAVQPPAGHRIVAVPDGYRVVVLPESEAAAAAPRAATPPTTPTTMSPASPTALPHKAFRPSPITIPANAAGAKMGDGSASSKEPAPASKESQWRTPRSRGTPGNGHSRRTSPGGSFSASNQSGGGSSASEAGAGSAAGSPSARIPTPPKGAPPNMKSATPTARQTPSSFALKSPITDHGDRRRGGAHSPSFTTDAEARRRNGNLSPSFMRPKHEQASFASARGSAASAPAASASAASVAPAGAAPPASGSIMHMQKCV